MAEQSLKCVFLRENSKVKPPLDPNTLYEIFMKMKHNECVSFIDMNSRITDASSRSNVIDDFFTKISFFRCRDLPDLYRIVRLYDYLTLESPYVSCLDCSKLIELLKGIKSLVVKGVFTIFLRNIPDLFSILNKTIISPPSIYDFLLFYNSMVPLTSPQKKDIEFLSLMLLYDTAIYKYPASLTALALIDIATCLCGDNIIIYSILGEYCQCTFSTYKSCLEDMLDFFIKTTSFDIIKKKINFRESCLTTRVIRKKIKTSIYKLSRYKNKIPYPGHTIYKRNDGLLSINNTLIVSDVKFQIGSKIGEGSYGSVYKLTNNNQLVAKIFDCAIDSVTEFINVTNMNHKWVGCVRAISSINPNILFYDRGGCDLERYVKGIRDPMGKPLIRSYVKQIITVVSYCHCNMVAHLDIKPGNIILHDDGTIRLIDFGSSRKFNPFIGQIPRDITTRLYAPPEALLKLEPYYSDIATDIWSIGICMAFMLSKGQIQYFHTRNDTPNVILDSLNDIFIIGSWKEIIPDINLLEEEFLSSLLKYDPRERINTLQALSHPYLN